MHPSPRGTCLRSRTPSSPWYLSKWSHALVPVALVQVAIRLRPCVLVQVVACPHPSFRHSFVRRHITGAHSYSDVSPALTRSPILRLSTSSLHPPTITLRCIFLARPTRDDYQPRYSAAGGIAASPAHCTCHQRHHSQRRKGISR
jgi:hypothetical protein